MVVSDQFEALSTSIVVLAFSAVESDIFDGMARADIADIAWEDKIDILFWTFVLFIF